LNKCCHSNASAGVIEREKLSLLPFPLL
jgi:hypothetical protein